MNNSEDTRPVLVLGATGAQGGAVVRHLLKDGMPVRALVRDAANAAYLQDQGAELTIGSFDDQASLVQACQGVRAVFSMQNAPFGPDLDTERNHGKAIINAARDAGVSQFVHTSVSGAGAFHRSMPGWGTGRWNENYWDSKADVEDMVRNGGFEHYTILKPAFMVENFTRPKADFMFPDLLNDEFVTAMLPDTKMVLVSAEDVGMAAAAAIADPEKFNRAEIELASAALTMTEIAAILSEATGRTITATTLSPEEICARGQFPGWVQSQEWTNEVPYPAKPADAEAYGLKLMDFRDWAKAHRADIALK